ncbi:MAG TPA: YbhB/YbcL family Raf kinase inhibitor-like protein [Kofleriaceae bacterium]
MKPQTETHKLPLTLRVESSAFGMNGSIPAQFTADGDDIAPPLSWGTAPAGTKSIAVLVEDPDAPNPDAPLRTFAHWIVTGIPATANGMRGGDAVPDGAKLGANDFGNQAWGGPNPPIGRHRYFFRVFALDIDLDDKGKGITRPELLAAIKDHILAQGELIGTYEKPSQRRSAAQAGAERTTHGRR